MHLFGYFLLLLCARPLSGQFGGCLTTHFNSVITKISGQYSDHTTVVTESTERLFYDEGRQMIVKEEYGHRNDLPFIQLRIFDFPKGILYDVTMPEGKENCSKVLLKEPFKKVCIPNNTQEIWLKSPLGSEDNMVPTVRFMWAVGNVTTELTYTYTAKPVIQNWYGTREEEGHGPVSVFETAWYTNITLTDAGPDVFTPPKSCNYATVESLQRDRTALKQWDGFLTF